jgi:para-nitrobenzyl esterase
MVFVHGGGFQSGSASEPMYGGARLAAQGVVVVAPNYRLGPLGFLPWEGGGNWGLQDLVEALRFVRRHAVHFGGDPNNVTLFGESAGAMLTCTLLAVPEARGLFHKAILQSGGCEEVRPLAADLPFGRRYAQALGCQDLECLRRLPLSAFFRESAVLTQAASTQPFSLSPFKPHVDGRLLPQTPLRALEVGEAAPVPLVVGSNQEELMPFFGAGSWLEVERLLRPVLGEKTEAVLAFYRARYPKPQEGYWRLETDRLFHCPALAAARAQAPYAPTHLYRFAFRSPDLPFLGSFHGLELAPLFGNLDQMPFLPLFLSAQARERAEEMGRILRRYWVSFAYQDAPKGWPRWLEASEGEALLLDLPPRPLPLAALDPGSCALF